MTFRTLLKLILFGVTMQYKTYIQVQFGCLNVERRPPQMCACLVSAAGSAAPPGESSHVVCLLLGGLDEAQKLELRHSSDKTGAGGRAEERPF